MIFKLSKKRKKTFSNLDQIKNLNILNKLNTTYNYNFSSLIQNNNFIFIINLLFNLEKMQNWQELKLTKKPIMANANYLKNNNIKNV